MMPEYQKVTLENGLGLITCPMPHTRSVSVLFFVRAGSCYETADQAGISHFIEHMCFKGTARRPTSREISEAIEGVGGIMNGGTDRELTSYWCKLASQHLETAVDVIVDLLRNPLYRQEDIDKERQVIIEEINMSLDSPQQRVGMIFDEIMWPDGPMGRDVAGSKETVSAITRKQMLGFMGGYYTPDNMLISLAGDFDPDKAAKIIGQATAGWQRGTKPEYYSSRPGQTAPRVRLEYRETEQVNLVLGVEGVSLFHPDRFAIDLLSMMLGEGMSSRLFTEIREKLGLAYDIHSYVEHFLETGVFVIQAGIDPGQTEKATVAILEQLARAGDVVSEVELHKAREMAKGRLLLSMENSRNVAGWFGAQEMLMGRIMTVDEVTEIIENITAKDVQRVAGDLFVTGKLNLAAVGPIKNESTLADLMTIK
ncbi:MAG: pitrilysin family protein [Dehalococcoidia bacterium]|jgi:predicted Zn-dependent peptidase